MDTTTKSDRTPDRESRAFIQTYQQQKQTRQELLQYLRAATQTNENMSQLAQQVTGDGVINLVAPAGSVASSVEVGLTVAMEWKQQYQHAVNELATVKSQQIRPPLAIHRAPPFEIAPIEQVSQSCQTDVFPCESCQAWSYELDRVRFQLNNAMNEVKRYRERDEREYQQQQLQTRSTSSSPMDAAADLDATMEASANSASSIDASIMTDESETHPTNFHSADMIVIDDSSTPPSDSPTRQQTESGDNSESEAPATNDEEKKVEVNQDLSQRTN